MRLVLLTNIISPHQMPLAHALARRLGEDNFRYIATEGEHDERTKLGWHMGQPPSWVIVPDGSAGLSAEASEWCQGADLLLSGLREMELFRERSARGLPTFYMSERWFKPPIGFLRMLHPRYLRMAWSLRKLLRAGSVDYLPMGLHAARDMARVLGLLSGDIRCLFRAPPLRMEAQVPLAPFSGSISQLPMSLWGYFVEAGGGVDGSGNRINSASAPDGGPASPLRLLWLGRMLDWKRADTLVRAVVRLLDEGRSFQLRVVGYGPEEAKLRRLAQRYLLPDQPAGRESGASGIFFQAPVPIQEVRGLMREAEVVVMSSDGGEGWGAVVNEAMAEGCCVVGTHEAGSSATLIEHGVNGYLYRTGDVSELANLLRQLDQESIRSCGERARETLDSVWSPEHAADKLIERMTNTSSRLG